MLPKLSRLTVLFLVAFPIAASAQARCTQETLVVRGTPVAVAYCIQGPVRSATGDELVVPVVESFGSPGGSFSRAVDIRFVAGEGVSRVLRSVDLAPAGVAGTLHLTLAYAGGQVRIESAMLTPGAVTIK